jgi:alkanesulfonate monooxygenase SsuD/methylene tetrahydromethanopterin reductase-like flavin-dependent oxidoreductase (luciferase family)
MTGVFFGKDDAHLQAKIEGRSIEDMSKRGMIIGTPNAVVDQLGKLSEVGVQRVMLNWFDLDDIDGLEDLAKAVL